MSPRSTLHSLGPTGPNEVTTRAFSEGEPGADPPAWVFERSLEGESEIPRVSAGTDAEANALWSSTGLTRAHHHAGPGSLAPAPGRQMSRRSTFSPGTGEEALCSPKCRKTRTLREHPPAPPPCRSTFPSLAPTGPNEVTTRAFSEGEPGADPTAWVFERSLEGESEIPRVSAGTDAEANARWSSTGLTRAHHHAGPGSLVPAPGRQMSRRSTFSPETCAEVRCSPKWRKTRTLREHPPAPPPCRLRLFTDVVSPGW